MSQSNLKQLFIEECLAVGIACQLNEKGIICFTPPCANVGEMIVYFDDGEITVDIENITHCHFTPYEAGETYPANTIEDCARRAASYVYDVLKDQRVLWRYPNGAGGTYLVGPEDGDNSDPPLEEEDVEKFLWSGPFLSQA
jgi:hypothetical protein